MVVHLFYMENKKHISFICKNCGETHVSLNRYSCNAIFCSNKCQGEFQTNERYLNWINGAFHPSIAVLKNYLIRLKGNACNCCGISTWNSKKIVLEIEHINGNSSDDSIENLELLCPNFHSQTNTYKGKNKGNGRYLRKIRYSLNKSY